LLGLARRKEWIAESFQQISVVAVPLLCVVVSDMVDASMFIQGHVLSGST
jgi:sodium/hydrogen antiporter